MAVEKLAGEIADDYSTDFDEVFARLKQAARVQTDVELSQELGIRQSSVSGAKKRKAIPPSWITAISKRFNVSADWLLYGEGSMRRGERAAKEVCPDIPMPLTEKRPTKWTYLWVVEPRIDEHGTLVKIIESWEHVFDRDYLETLGNPESIVAMFMPGNDMFPVIKNKDSILIDTSQVNMVSDYIYAVLVNGLFLVRRLTVSGKNILLNGYNCESVEVDPGEIRILGRIVSWTSR